MSLNTEDRAGDDTLIRPTADVLPEFVPVIFANGVDDDTPGLVAAVTNARVRYDEHIFEAGEDITIFRRRLYLSRPLVVIGADTPVPETFDPATMVLVRETNEAGVRHTTIAECNIHCPAPFITRHP